MNRAAAEGLDALLVTHVPDVRYLSGFTGSSGALLLVKARALLFTDGRYTDQAQQEALGIRVVVSKQSAAIAAIEWAASAGLNRCGFDAAHTTVASLDAMRRALPAALRRKMLVATNELVAAERERKDPDEIAAIRVAAKKTCEVFEGLLGDISPTLTEAELALLVEDRARRAGAERMSFDTIVAGGPRGALPHAHPTRQKLPRRGLVTLDFGLVYRGYCSDMTRTIAIGRISSHLRAVYDSVLEAQESAVARIAPGVAAKDVDEAAREVLRRVELDQYFSHSTGHGVGIEIHEGPRLAAKQDAKLSPGMVVTVEPGVYVSGRYGIRIEDMVLVTTEGHEILTSSTKALIEL